jgi:uncharacterized RDD family membrane protein YckC
LHTERKKQQMANATILTNRYIRIDQTPASVGERMLARFIDLCLIFFYTFAVRIIIGLYGKIAPDFLRDGETILILYLLFLTPALFYSPLWEFFNHGQSPGKKLLGLRVVMKDGSTPSLGAYLLRWLLLTVDLYFFQCIGILSILLTKNSQRIGDLAAGTLVIKEKNYRQIHVTLNEFAHLSAHYRPVFPQAENLSLEQVNLIRQTLFRYDAQRPQRLRDLGFQVRRFLQINPLLNDENFLLTLTRDFQYYALEEI